MIRVDAEISEKAKNIGLNISKVCENALFRAVEAMEAAYGDNTVKTTVVVPLKNADGGPSRIRTGDYRDVNAVS